MTTRSVALALERNISAVATGAFGLGALDAALAILISCGSEYVNTASFGAYSMYAGPTWGYVGAPGVQLLNPSPTQHHQE